MDEREELYQKVSPPGDPNLINDESFDLDDSISEDVEIRAVAAGLRNGRAGGSGGVQAEHIKTWLHGITKDRRRTAAGKVQGTYGDYLSD